MGLLPVSRHPQTLNLDALNYGKWCGLERSLGKPGCRQALDQEHRRGLRAQQAIHYLGSIALGSELLLTLWIVSGYTQRNGSHPTSVFQLRRYQYLVYTANEMERGENPSRRLGGVLRRICLRKGYPPRLPLSSTRQLKPPGKGTGKSLPFRSISNGIL